MIFKINSIHLAISRSAFPIDEFIALVVLLSPSIDSNQQFHLWFRSFTSLNSSQVLLACQHLSYRLVALLFGTSCGQIFCHVCYLLDCIWQLKISKVISKGHSCKWMSNWWERRELLLEFLNIPFHLLLRHYLFQELTR